MKKFILFIFLFFLIYTRFVNLGWGLPLPFHPDERNMAAALQQFECSRFSILDLRSSIINCFNPHFFAYGQLPLYLGYILVKAYHFLFGSLNDVITFTQAVMALRLISAIASVINVLVMIKVVELFVESFRAKGEKSRSGRFAGFLSRKLLRNDILIAFPIFIFSPALIQFAHFGTTESLLMLFYSVIVYVSLLFLNRLLTLPDFIKWSAIVGGLSVGTKVSSLIFILIPLSLILINKKFKGLLIFAVVFAAVAVLSSPYNLISFNEFISSMRYESAVGLGTMQVFYTRQFIDTVPVIFQFFNIFPYALGWIVLALFFGGFFILPFKRNFNIFRLSFLIYFLFNAFLFTKWTRFMTPVMPIMLIISALFLQRIFKLIKTPRPDFVVDTPLKKRRIIPLFTRGVRLLAGGCLIVLAVLPGVAYLSIYNNEDVRITASRWIYKNIPVYARILSEDGNVVDIPIPTLNDKRSTLNFRYNLVSFDFYNLDESSQLQADLFIYSQNADYIFVPSRRVFANHKKNYPQINQYYNRLFSGNLGFKEIIRFTSYPKITLFNKTLLEFKDEQAEETWSVFDHPVIRIYSTGK
ncbi:MAG: hypothetical protein HYW86_04070 [Candidatus Roizmanbacteria bacterium]|nr:MAG: hypothetical protein HYW86_04070 [Candidatus Roizmanbacteria bacterium]